MGKETPTLQPNIFDKPYDKGVFYVDGNPISCNSPEITSKFFLAQVPTDILADQENMDIQTRRFGAILTIGMAMIAGMSAHELTHDALTSPLRATIEVAGIIFCSSMSILNAKTTQLIHEDIQRRRMELQTRRFNSH